jgi:hypothetical protein
MNIQQFVQMYEAGAITPHHLVLESLNLLDSQGDEGVEAVLGALPPQVHLELRAFVENYRPGKMVANYGNVPSPRSVGLASYWLADHLISQSR